MPSPMVQKGGKASFAMGLVLALFIALALVGVLSLWNGDQNQTLQPLPQPPIELADLPSISLVAILNRSKLDQLTLEFNAHILRQRPLYQRLPDDDVPHPSEGFELRLDWAESMVYAEASQAGGYRFVVFCMPERKCYSERFIGAPPVFKPVAFLRFGAEDAAAARQQLEALHRLILLEGGQPVSDPGKTLSQRLRELPQDPG